MKAHRISQVEETGELITSRAGLSLFGEYISSLGIATLLTQHFGHFRKSKKGTPVESLFYQVLCFFTDGSSRSLAWFDVLKLDAPYAATLGLSLSDIVSSNSIKRFFKKFPLRSDGKFRKILGILFTNRLQEVERDVFIFGLDTMVMDNDDAQKRHGCSPTYKKKKGFHVLNLTWEGMIVDTIFRAGKSASYDEKLTKQVIRRAVEKIRHFHGTEIAIIFRFDGAYFDQSLFKFLDELGVLFICGGKKLPGLKGYVEALPAVSWELYCDQKGSQWRYAEYGYRADSWKTMYRTIYTCPCNDETGQMLLSFAQSENVIITNIGMNPEMLASLPESKQAELVHPERIIESYHQRGADELPHRAFKDFVSEKLPFQRFAQNAAWYYLMVIAFFVFSTWQRDVVAHVLPELRTSYASTLRRRLIDIGGKIVRSGRRIILKLSSSVFSRLKFEELWEQTLKVRALLVPAPT